MNLRENINKLFIFFKDFEDLQQTLLNPEYLESIHNF